MDCVFELHVDNDDGKLEESGVDKSSSALFSPKQISNPVATVSGAHARIRKKQDNLLVIDLDNTNETFIDDKRLRPGVVTAVFFGSCITFDLQFLSRSQVAARFTYDWAGKE
ncbi:hypothetical protein P8452_10590 [Trifolium repens]|nr:hypothetical protein P8452_10590 [Trifolium repens]